MDTEQILFYIVAAIIYFLSRKKKKRVNPPAPPEKRGPERERRATREPETEDVPEPALSFEDLLKELTGQSTAPRSPEPREAPAPVPVPVPDPEPPKRRREMGEEMELLRSSFDDEAIKKKFEDSIVTETKTSGTGKKKKKRRFEPYQEKEENGIADEIKSMLTNPDDVKKAIILQEVLGRRF